MAFGKNYSLMIYCIKIKIITEAAASKLYLIIKKVNNLLKLEVAEILLKS